MPTDIYGLEKIEVDYEVIHQLSMEQLEAFEEEKVNAGYGMLTCCLTLGRLNHLVQQMDPDPDKEAEFVEAAMDFCAAYFAPSAPGAAN